MKIGALVFLTEQSGNPGAIAREVENLGFESFFVAEHMVVPSTYTTHYPRSRDGKVPEFYARLIDPFVALAIAADATSRIKIGTAICLLPQRDVIETAKVTASIDLYSKGRLILGVGAGWFREEAQVMGVDFARRWQHLRESVEALARAVERRRRELRGRHHQVPAGQAGSQAGAETGTADIARRARSEVRAQTRRALCRRMVPGRSQRREGARVHSADQEDGEGLRPRSQQARVLGAADGRRRADRRR